MDNQFHFPRFTAEEKMCFAHVYRILFYSIHYSHTKFSYSEWMESRGTWLREDSLPCTDLFVTRKVASM